MSAWQRLLDALRIVENLEETELGMLCFGETASAGGLLVERRQVCWALAPGMQRRLRELFAAHPADRRTALLRHTAESLLGLCEREAAPHWATRGGNGFSAEFTFAPREILFEAAGVRWADHQHAARNELARLGASGSGAVAFIAEPALSVAVPVAAVEPATVGELAELGQWACALLLAARELGTSARFALATNASGESLLVWRRAPAIYVVQSHDRARLAALALSPLVEAPL